MNAANILSKKIVSYLNRKLLLQGISGSVNLAVLLLIIWVSTFTADSILYFSVPVRWFVLLINLLLSLFLTYRFLIYDQLDGFRIKKSGNLTKVTKEIGSLLPGIDDSLTNTYQLTKAENGHDSDALRQLAIDNFIVRTAAINFSAVLKLKNYLFSPYVIFLIIAGSLILSGQIPQAMQISGKRIFNPTGNYELVPEFSFNVLPGDTTLLTGKKLTIEAQYHGPVSEKILLSYKHEGEEYFKISEMKFSGENYSLEIDNIKTSMTYHLQALPAVKSVWQDKLISESFDVLVKVPPVITDLQIRIKPPGYTGLPEQVLDKNQGNIIAYQGSNVQVTAVSSKTVAAAQLIFTDSSSVTLAVRENRVTGNFTVRKSGTYQIAISDHENIANQDPLSYQVAAINDRYPTIELIEPGDDLEIPPDAAINLVSEANDDFGFSQLQLNYQVISSVPALGDTLWRHLGISIEDARVKYFQKTYLWNFRELNVGYGDAMNYYMSIADNDGYNGPKWSRSKIYHFRFPTLDQLFNEFDKSQDQNIEKTREISEESQELKKKIEEISRELKRDKEIDWERKKEIESAIEKQNKIREKLDKIDKELEEAISKMEKSQMLSPEILQKYQQLQELFQELMTPELAKSLEELQKSLEQLNKSEVEKSLNDFKLNQEQFVQNVERTLELFKKIKIEQELDRMVQLAKTMLDKQEEISKTITQNDQPEEKKEQKLDQETGRQKDLLEQIKNSLKELETEPVLKEYPETEQLLNQSRDQIARRDLTGQLNDLQEKIQQSEQSAATEMSQQLTAEMNQLHNTLSQAQQNMKTMARNNIMQKMERATNNLLKLSQNEEQLWRETRSASGVSNQMRDIAAKQQTVAENASRVFQDIVELSHETFALPQELNKALGKANYHMRNSISDLEQRNQAGAGKSQLDAMAGLNEAVGAMQAAGEQMKSSDSPFGLENFLQEMQKLAQGQGQINQESLNLMQGEQGPPSGEGQGGRLKRLAAEQRAIQESFDQMLEEQGDSHALGRLDKVSEEMKDVVKDLEALKINRNTIERQQRILTRMLDAQRSVREREYSRERKAEVGKNYSVMSPGEDQETVDKRAKKLQVDLLRALQEGYLPDYEKLIEEYFKILNQQNLNRVQPQKQ